MGQYKVYYFEDLENAEVRINCPICENIRRNVIDPVAVILTKEDYNRFEDNRNRFEDELNSINNLDELKNSEVFNHILNQDDLVCIFHQKKEGKHWEEDTKEFEEWNNRVLKLRNEEDLEKEFNSLDEDNLVNQFWKRIRAYRFSVDYLELWEKNDKDWNTFIDYLIENKEKVDTNRINKEKNLIRFYLLNKLFKDRYNFIKFFFPLFLIPYYLLIKEIKSRPNRKFILKANFNFWYKDEKIVFKKRANFRGTTFNNEADFSGITFNNVANFNGTTFNNVANFSGTIFNNKIYFRKTTFNDKVDFTGAIFNNVAFFIEITFNDKAFFIETTFNNVANFNKTTFNNVAYFWQTIFDNKAYFWQTIFNNKAVFSKTTFNDEVDFTGTTFNNVANFSKTTFNNKAYFWQITFNNEVDFSETIFNNIAKFYECKFLNLKFDSIKTSEKTHLELKNLKIVEFNLTGIVNHINIFLISNVEIITLNKFKQEINQKNKFNKIQPKINIKNSILNNVKFINCDFSQAKIEIKDSHLEETTFSNINWGEVSEERICPNLSEKEPDKARDIYRQLKLSLEKQADYINANWFYALEMKAYEKYLQSQSWKEYFQDKLVFIFHKFISNFGQSWVRPFILIILSTFLLLGFAYQTNIEIIFPIPDKLKNLLTIKQSIFMPIYEILSDKPEYLLTLYNLAGIILIFQLIKDKEINKKKILYIFEKSILALTLAFILTIPIVIIFKLTTKLALLDAIANLLDNFATTLNIFNVFQLFSRDEQGNLTNTPHFYDGYYFIYKIYAIFILILIYQLIVAIRRRVRR